MKISEIKIQFLAIKGLLALSKQRKEAYLNAAQEVGFDSAMYDETLLNFLKRQWEANQWLFISVATILKILACLKALKG